MSVEIVTFGCRLNIVESEAMAREARAAGHRNLTVINTCGVTAEAARQSRQAVRRAARERPGARVVVTGCAAAIEPARFRDLPGVTAILPNASKSAPASWRALPGGLPRTALPTAGGTDDLDGLAVRHTRAFVEVQNGCDHRCTFCMIPSGRGVSRSTAPAAVVERIRNLVEAGAREAVLTGVDVTSYMAGGMTLGHLVKHILAEVPALPRLRLSSLDCIEADPALLDCFADEPRLMPHLHLSVQAGADLILKRMARRHRRADVVAFCQDIRRLRPETSFGADFIAGFPTETEQRFAETLELITACDLSYIHAFPFSPRPGTPAARMPAVPGDVVRERAARLRDCGHTRLLLHLDRRVGHTVRVLSERGDMGHAEDFTRVRLPAGTPAGSILRIAADRHDSHALDATDATLSQA